MEIKKLMPGTKVKVIANTANHDRPINSVVTIKGSYVNPASCINLGYFINESACYLFYADIKPVYVSRGSIKEYFADLVRQEQLIEKEKLSTLEKLNYLNENNLDEFDEYEYKISKVIKEFRENVNTSKTNVEIAKLIADVIKS